MRLDPQSSSKPVALAIQSQILPVLAIVGGIAIASECAWLVAMSASSEAMTGREGLLLPL